MHGLKAHGKEIPNSQKNLTCIIHYLTCLKLVPGPKMTKIGCWLGMVVLCTIGKPMERRDTGAKMSKNRSSSYQHLACNTENWSWAQCNPHVTIESCSRKKLNQIFYLQNFVRRKNLCLSLTIASIFLFIPVKEKSYEPLWASNIKSTDKTVHRGRKHT